MAAVHSPIPLLCRKSFAHLQDSEVVSECDEFEGDVAQAAVHAELVEPARVDRSPLDWVVKGHDEGYGNAIDSTV